MNPKIAKLTLAAAAGVVGLVSAAPDAEATIVINEIYGAGGNANSLYDKDFFELYNNDLSTSVNLAGYVFQYGSATGNFASSSSNEVTLPSFTLPPQSYFLITGASGGTNGAATPTGNATSAIQASATAGKLRLLDGVGGTTVDLVGFGTGVTAATATTAGGTGPGFETTAAPAPSTTTSITRTLGLDTNNNSIDFTTSAAPSPTNSVPEPASAGLAAAAGALLLGRRNRAAKK